MDKIFQLKTKLVPFNNRYMNYVVLVPTETAEALGGHNTRVIGKLNGVGFRLALLNTKDGEYYLSAGKQLRQNAKLREGEPVDLEIGKDPNPDYVELGEAFEALLDDDPEARAIWQRQTVGFRRSLAHYLTTAKRAETQIKRAVEVARRLKEGDFQGMR